MLVLLRRKPVATETCLKKQTGKDGIIENNTMLAAFPEQEVRGSCKVFWSNLKIT
jgi:hypothetical protein